jgi:hypothetical protein
MQAPPGHRVDGGTWSNRRHWAAIADFEASTARRQPKHELGGRARVEQRISDKLSGDQLGVVDDLNQTMTRKLLRDEPPGSSNSAMHSPERKDEFLDGDTVL